MSKEAQRCWHALFRAIMENFEVPERRQAIAALINCLRRLQVAQYRAIARNGEASLRQLEAFIDAYMRVWCAGDIDREAMGDVMARLLAWLRAQNDDAFVSLFEDLLGCLIAARDLGLCELGRALDKCDPAWARFIGQINRGMPNPLCPREPPRRPECGDDDGDKEKGYGRGKGRGGCGDDNHDGRSRS
jgi:hypothetical protein